MSTSTSSIARAERRRKPQHQQQPQRFFLNRQQQQQGYSEYQHGQAAPASGGPVPGAGGARSQRTA